MLEGLKIVVDSHKRIWQFGTMTKAADQKQGQFVLVSNIHGVDVFPKIAKSITEADTVTSNQAETPVYDFRDNCEMRANYWAAVLKRQFEVRYL